MKNRHDRSNGSAYPAAGSGLDAMTEAKLWQNPCWFTYRLNYLALRYNVPLYSWVESRYGLSRPEFVVIYSLGLKDRSFARDIGASSGFPQNTLSRAIHRLAALELIMRKPDARDRRRFQLSLTPAGRSLFEEALPHFVDYEALMLDTLSPAECRLLSTLMAKMVLAAPAWPDSVEAENGKTTSKRTNDARC